MNVTAEDSGVDFLLFTWDFGDHTSSMDNETVNAYRGPKKDKTLDLGSQVISTMSHTYALPGIYPVTVTISNGVNSTVETFPVLVNDPSVTTDASQFAVSKTALKFTFDKQKADSLSMSGTLPVPVGLAPNGKILTVIFGGHQSQFTLNAKGQGLKGGESIKLSGKLSKKDAYSASSVKFQYTVKDGNLFSSLFSWGFSNATVKNQAITVPVEIDLNNECYQASAILTYTATNGKTGSAK